MVHVLGHGPVGHGHGPWALGMGPWARAHGHGPMGMGPWAWAHGHGPMGPWTHGPWPKGHGPKFFPESLGESSFSEEHTIARFVSDMLRVFLFRVYEILFFSDTSTCSRIL